MNVQGKHFFITPDIRPENASLRVVLAEARRMRQDLRQRICTLDEQIKALRDDQEALLRQERDTEEQLDRLSQFCLTKEDTAPTNVRITALDFDPLDIQALACAHPEASDAPAVQVRTLTIKLHEMGQQQAIPVSADSSVPRGPLLATDKEDVAPQVPAKLPAPSGLEAGNSANRQAVPVLKEVVPPEEEAIRNLDPSELFTPKQAAALLGPLVSAADVMELYRENNVRAVAVGCAMRFYGYALRELWEYLNDKKLPLGAPGKRTFTQGPWSVTEVATLYKVHPATIRELCEDGVLEPVVATGPGYSCSKRKITEEELARVFPSRYIDNEANLDPIPDRFQDIDEHLAKRCYVDGKQYSSSFWLEAIRKARIHYWRWGLTHFRTKEEDIEKIKEALRRLVQKMEKSA